MEKAKIYDPEKENEAFTVQFNPNSLEYSIHSNQKSGKKTNSKTADSAAEEENLQSDPTGYTDKATLSVRLFFHTYQNETTYTDVREEVKKIRKFVRRSSNSASENDPKVTFAWGTICHTGTLDSFSVTYQMFASDGTPVQAEVSISISGEDADRAVEKANQLIGAKAALKEPMDEPVRDPLQTTWDWLYL